MQRGSNVGQGQIKAADYVLVAEVQGANGNVSGSALPAASSVAVWAALPPASAARSWKPTPSCRSPIVHTTETIATTEGYTAKTSLAFGGGGFLGGVAGAVGDGYDNTDIGRIVTLSFIQAYYQSGDGTEPGAAGRPGHRAGDADQELHGAASGGDARVDATVYPTGNKNSLWWEVADENNNVGWVLNTGLAPSQY